MLLLVTALFLGEPEWRLEDTGIFVSLSLGLVAHSEQLDWYLLDLEEKKILRYNAKGERLADISGRGQGPDRLDRPNRIQYINGRLYVFDRQFIKVFHRDGVFIERLSAPEKIWNIKKVKYGWVGLGGMSFHEKTQRAPLQLLWFDERMSSEETMHSWPSETDRTGEAFSYDRRMKEMRRKTTPYNPTERISSLHTGPRGLWAYVLPSGEDRIYIFDLSAKKLFKALDLSGPCIPFKQAWGERQLEKAQLDADRLFPGQTKYEADFPDCFPHVRNIGVSLQNRLAVFKWTLTPPQNDWLPKDSLTTVEAYTAEGEPTELTGLERHLGKVAAVENGMAYVFYSNEDQMFTIARCSVDEIDAFYREHPLAYAFQGLALLK